MTVSAKMSIEMRLATPVDLGTIHELLTDAGLPLEGVAENLHNVFLGEVGPLIVATAGVELYAEVGLVRSVAVRSGHRGTGHGTRIVETVLQRAKSKGVREFYLLTTTAPDFFQACGFQSVDRDDAPAAIQTTREFMALCPASATLMRSSR